jgi:hypothetical protein
MIEEDVSESTGKWLFVCVAVVLIVSALCVTGYETARLFAPVRPATTEVVK